MKKLLLLILTLTLFSCNRQTDFEKKLIGSKWVFFEGDTLKDELDKWPMTYLRFYGDGSIKEFYVPSPSDFVKVGNDTEPKKPHNWQYFPEEKKLLLYGHEFKVMTSEGDTIRMQKDTIKFMLYNIDKTHAKLKKGPWRCLGG